jgi:hypothetical protein
MKMRQAGLVALFGEIRNVYQILVAKPKGKRSFGRRSNVWEDNIKGDCVVWIIELLLKMEFGIAQPSQGLGS